MTIISYAKLAPLLVAAATTSILRRSTACAARCTAQWDDAVHRAINRAVEKAERP
jgi:hypothetical protein